MDKTTLSELLVEIRRIEEHRQKGAEKQIKQHYESLLKDLREFLGVSYAKLAEDDVLTYAILQQKGEFARFLDEVVKKVNNITPKAATEITSVVNDVYELAYNGVVKAVAAADTVGALHTALQGLPLVTPEIIKRAVENPISGLTLKDTLEKNRKEIVYNIKREIGTGLTQGDRMSTMAKRIQSQIDIDYRKAMTITRTEVHRVREAGNCDSAKDISASLDKGDSGMVMVKIWRTMQDESVRPQRQPYKRKSGVKARKKATAGLRSSLSGANHVKMEGATVKADEPFNLGGGVYADAPGGSGVAGHDINCRCFVEYDLLTVAEFEKATGKKYKNPLTSEVSSGMMEREEPLQKTAPNRYASMTADQRKIAINDKAISKAEMYAVKNWGVETIDLKGLDAHAITKTFKEMNKVFEEFPILKGTIKQLVQIEGKDRLMATNFSGTMVFNPEFYKDVNAIKKAYESGVKTGFSPKGTNWTNVAVHELGHRLNVEAIKKKVVGENARITDWNNDELATKIVNQALKKVRQQYQIKGMKKDELLCTISGYAATGDGESIAEAFSDYYSNGENANIISRTIMKILKEMLK